MKPSRKGTPITNNPWGQSNAPGTARSGGIVTPKVVLAPRDDTQKTNGKSDYTRKPAGMNDASPGKMRTVDTKSPQPYVNKSKS